MNLARTHGMAAAAAALVLMPTRNFCGSAYGLAVPLESLTGHAVSFASAHGLQVEQEGAGYECAPISLLPNAFPREAFQKSQSLARPFNELVDRISRDGDFLVQTLGGGVSEADPYTGKLLALYQDIYMKDGGFFAKQADRLGIHRSDYMLNMEETGRYDIKQVELNTIAASFAGLASNVASMHRYLIARFEKDVRTFLDANKAIIQGSTTSSEEDGVPVSPALTCLPNALAIAHERYRERFLSEEEESPVLLFVVQDGETNTVDQRLLEFRLWELHSIPVVRMSLTKAFADLELNDETGALRIPSLGREVSVVYFRAGYAPTDYPDDKEWQSRERIERSRATKCPSLGYHLAGTKKVQQELARPGTLERFFPDESVEAMRQAFAGLYSLGTDANDDDLAAVKDALSGRAGRYVLKPQREGGGYNFYGENLAQKLQDNVETTESTITLKKDLAEFILMERLFPPQQPAILLRSGRVAGSGESISELGCFGAIVVANDGEVIHNEYAGFLLRTKFTNVDEGGVASGFATLSSPYLC